MHCSVGRQPGWTERQRLDIDAALAEGRRYRREGPAQVTPSKTLDAQNEYYAWLRQKLEKDVDKDAPYNRELQIFRLPPPMKPTAVKFVA